MNSTGEIEASVFGSQKAAEAAFDRKSGFSGPFHIQDGSILVRFLTEMDSWVGYSEVFDQETRRYRVLRKGEVSTESPTRRILASVLLKDPEGDRVISIRLPWSLGQTMKEKYKRLGTIQDRDYVITKSGAGLDTRYDVDTEAPTPCDVSAYVIPDLMTILNDGNAVKTNAAPPVVAPSPKAVVAPQNDDDLDLDLDLDLDAGDLEVIDEDVPAMTMDDLMKSSVKELKDLAKTLGVTMPAGGTLTKRGLIDLLWAEMQEPF